MFIEILYGFGVIWLELSRIDAVFSRTTVVLSFVQKWKFSKWAETFWRFFWNKKDSQSFMEGPEGEGVGNKTPGGT